MSVDEGWRRVAEGDLFGALTPFTEALRMEQNDPQRAEMHRLRLASVLQQCPKLVQVWSVGGQLTRAALSPDRERILTATTLSTNQAVAQIWEASTGRPLTAPMEHAGAISSLEWSADGSRVVTASEDRTARVWDAATGRPLSKPLQHEAAVVQARFNAKGTRVATAVDDRDVKSSVGLWDIALGQELWRVQCGLFGSAGSTTALCLSPDDRFVVAGTDVLDATTGKVLHKLPDCQGGHYLEFTADGSRALLTGHFRGTNTASARILDGPDLRRVLAVTPSPDHPLYGRLSPDARRVATFTDYNALRIWDVGTGLPITGPMAHRGIINSISYSADGRRVATACSDQTARVWDALSGASVTPPLPHRGAVLTEVRQYSQSVV
jgi:WD40 repeat protein